MTPLTHEYHELVEAIDHMKPDETKIKELHDTYMRMTGMDTVPLTLGRMFQWEAFCHAGYNENDLRLVIEVLRRKIKTGPNTTACLRFSNLIGNIEHFQEELGIARAMSRLPKVDRAKESVLRATGRPTHHDKPPRTAAQVLAGEEAFKAFRAFKETL